MAQTYDISLGSDTVEIDGILEQTDLIAIQVVGESIDSDITLSLQQSIDGLNWHDLPELALTDSNISYLLRTKSFETNLLAVKVEVGSATTGSITITNPNNTIGVNPTSLGVNKTQTLFIPTSVTDAETLEGQNGAYYLDRTNHTGTQSISTLSDFEAPIDGSQYARKDAGWELVDVGVVQDMTGLMIERTTDLALTGTYQELTFDTTSLENNPSELEHDNVNTERVDIKTNGMHQLAMSFNCDNSSVSLKVLEAELRINGTPVKSLSFDVTKSSEELVCRVLLSELVSGTYLTVAFREQGGGADLTLKANSVVSIVKMQGTKGNTGDTGAGSNIIVQKDDSTVGTVTDTLNFEGNSITSVVDDGGGKTTVTINSEL